MKIKYIYLAYIIFIINSAYTQPSVLWTNTYGGMGDDSGHSVCQTSDGGYVIAGYTESFGAGNADVYLLKTDAEGTQLWYRTFGGVDDDYGESIQQTSDSGYIIAGYTDSLGADGYDIYLIKTDSSGNLQWERTYNFHGNDWAYCVRQTSNEGYIICGYTDSIGAGYLDALMMKTDSAGGQLWYHTYGGASWDKAFSVEETCDSGFVIGGYTYSYGAGSSDYYLIKTDSLGNQLWDNTYGETCLEEGMNAKPTVDGGYIIVGRSEIYGAGNTAVYLVKTDSAGCLLWEQYYGGGYWDIGFSIQQTTDEGFLIAGRISTLSNEEHDLYILKTDSAGLQQWFITIGGGGPDAGFSAAETSDGCYIIAGETSSFGAGRYDVYLVKVDADSLITSVNTPGFKMNHTDISLTATPNPFNSKTVISFELKDAGEVSLIIYDIQGREVRSLVTSHLSLGPHEVVWDAVGLTSRVYFVKLQTGDFSETQKILLMK